MSSPGCSEINVMSLFNNIPRTKRSHGHKRIQHPNVKKTSKPRTLQDTFNDLLSNIQKPLGIHHIRTILFSLPVNYLKDLRDFGLDNILNRKEVVKEIPPYFKNQSVPIVSYSYTNSIGRTIFNYKETLQDINIEEHLKNPLTCDCSHSPFQYNPSVHVITGDLNIIQHESPKGDFSWS